MKLMEKMKKAKKDNKGFSLVELIIVIAIMAILVGIVGTQVIPYLSKSKVAKDQQVLNSVNTAAVTAYSENVEQIDTTSPLIIDNVFVDPSTLSAEPAKQGLVKEIQTLTGFTTLTEFTNALSSNDTDKITAVKVTYNFNAHEIVTEVVYSATVKYPIENVTGTL